MASLSKLLRLSPTDLRLLLVSFFLVVAVRLGLWVLPFRTLRRLLAKMKRTSVIGPEADRSFIKKAAWAVEVTSRYVPAASCLTQALATLVILGRIGQPACLRIGVAKTDEGKLQAHAWVESEGQILIGRLDNLSHYRILSPLQKEIL